MIQHKNSLSDKAMLAAFETLVARELVTRQELLRWNCDAQLNARKTLFTIVFKNRGNSRRIECEVPATLDTLPDGGVKISVEILMIMAGATKKVPESPWTDVLFNADKPRTVQMRTVLRRRAA
ncbi:MAG: hypothetical protein NTX72_01100 [Candidatus Uhrbacteria bacterium]|nr:hypothetical protein [Candidatus Uhrbacteria bacterium]